MAKKVRLLREGQAKERKDKVMLNFLIGGLLATVKPAQLNMIDKERETVRFAFLPTLTTSGRVWLKRYRYVERYVHVGPGPFGMGKSYGWRFVENRRGQ